MDDRTLIIVKPDAVERGLVGQVLARFEAAGFEIVQMRFGQLPEELFRRFYAEHEGKPHFARLLAYMTSGPSCFAELRREGAVARARALCGATDPADALPGTIRGDLGINLPRNSVHASDAPASAQREIALIFGADAVDVRSGHAAG
ncbi:MAG: nucleoside-diphosphate kinase [Armatimonadota bacterium]